jgi:cysteine desulfurase / selenocysteine lyase
MTEAIDVARARRETPGCANVLHFNNAGAALPPECVLDAMIEHTRREGAIGGYEAAAEALEKVEHTYDALAVLLGCGRDEVAVVENATRAWDMAFYAIPFARGDRILTGRAEYASNYIAFLQVARRTGAEIGVVPSEPSGEISVAALEEALRRDGRVKLVAMTHVPTNGGLVNPAAEVGQRARAAGALFLLDACQSAGQRPLDIRELQCDMLSATGRKYLRGPRGTGFLYVRRGVLERLEPPFLDLHAATWTAADRYEVRGDARRFENWEGNVAAKIGLGVAVDYALGWGLPAIQARVGTLARLLRERLAAVPGATVRDIGTDRCGIVTFTLEGRDPAAVRDALSARSMNTTVTSAAATRLDMDARGLLDMVRASVHYYNTEEEIARFVAAVAAL